MFHVPCSMYILGVRIDNLTKKEILEKIEFFLNEDKFHQIATVNPEFILKAQKNDEFKNVLNGCNLNVADGIGIWYAFIRNFGFLKKRFAGVDLLDEVFRKANEKKLSVYLAINGNGLSKYSEIKKVLEKKYRNVNFSGKNFYELGCLYKIQNTKYEILVCNFGAPHQEIFLNAQKRCLPEHFLNKEIVVDDNSKKNNQNYNKNGLQNERCRGKIRLAMGVGGSLDFMTNKAKRAPKIIRIMGLEWFWRLFFHPSTNKRFILKRIKRIFQSVMLFPIRVTLGK